jgi:thymidylate kinase
MPRSFVLELTGLPAAGKTSAAEMLASRLQARSISCQLIEEAARHNPLQEKKCQWEFNAWSSCHTLTSLLEVQAMDPPTVIILDRGLVDAQCWMLWFKLRRELDTTSYTAIRNFLRGPRWAASTSLVAELQVEFDTALNRRQGDTGRIFNLHNFSELRRAYDATLLDRHARSDNTELIRIDTNDLSLSEVVDRLEDSVNERLQQPPGVASLHREAEWV